MFGKHKDSMQGTEKSLQTAEEMAGKKEIGFNIWFIIDQSTNICYYYIIRSYCISGSEEKKLAILNELAKYDFITSPRRHLPENCVITIGSEKYSCCLPSYGVDDYFVNNFNYFATEVEKTLPPAFRFNTISGGNHAIAQKLPDAPLYVRTFVIEDDYGNLIPKITENKKEFYR